MREDINMSWIGKHIKSYMGKVVSNGQCVRFVQVCGGLPHTSRWRKGARVRGLAQIQTGTAAATFDPTGRYGNHTDGRSHACFIMTVTHEGILAIDQWRGQPVHQRLIRFREGGKPVNNANSYSIIETV